MQIKLWDKSKTHPPGHGYNLRNNPLPKFSIVVHTTNGKKDSAFTDEETFLFNTSKVSAHFLIGKDGQITQYFADIAAIEAWHAGAVSKEMYSNTNSIGIELHYTPGENKNVPRMMEALTWLVQELMRAHAISEIVMHRQIAVYDSGPKKGQLGRKIDPSHLTNQQFYAWREQVMTPLQTPIIGQINVSIDQLRDRLARRGVFEYEIVPIVTAVTTYGELTRLGNVYPLAQWAHETGWGKSERWIKSRNPAGLGATNDGAWGAHFASISEGFLAHYAHLLCYATTPTENSFIIERIAELSPRKNAMEKAYGRGSARTYQALSNKWNLGNPNYGQTVVNIAKQYLL